MTIPFGKRSSVNLSAASSGSAQVQVQKSAATVHDWGYEAYVSAGGSNHQFAEMQYKSSVGQMTAGMDQSSGTTTFRVEDQGALSWVDHGLFPSNTVYDSFAIVDTGPMTHIHVLQENREVGRTNAAGRLLVPDMRSFDLNHLAIVSTDVPPDVTVDEAFHTVRPRDLSGVVVKFPIKFSHGALLHLVDQEGQALPVGTVATLRAARTSVPVGYDGQAYVENLDAKSELDAELPDGRRCSLAFGYHATPGDIPTIGPLMCKVAAP